MTGLVFDIQRFCTHDGPGIRTAVFFKGCPLKCPWCHNPESKAHRKELFYNPMLCIGCGQCADACPNGANTFEDGVHLFHRNRCCLCLTCTQACNAKAFEPAGREMTVEEVLSEIERDRVFYEESGGGLTVSGGEPMMQFEFTKELLSRAKSLGISTCMETSGYASSDSYTEIVPYVDLLLWDIKDTEHARHRKNTGVPLDAILSNLAQLDSAGAETILRCLLVGGINTYQEHLDGIASIFHKLRNCSGVELLAYHPMGASKLERLGKVATQEAFFTPHPEYMEEAKVYLARGGVKVLG